MNMDYFYLISGAILNDHLDRCISHNKNKTVDACLAIDCVGTKMIYSHPLYQSR